MMAPIRFLGRLTVSGTLTAVSGLHIGAGKDTIEIGGIDNPVVKHPHTNEPYVPGSSLKGKIRFLMEWGMGKVQENGLPWGQEAPKDVVFDPTDPILRLFGTPAKREQWSGGPTRLVCRDAPLERDWVRSALDQGLLLTEDKTEVAIDRLAGKAHDKVGPRQTERVPSGARFEVAFVLRLYDTGDGGDRDLDCAAWFLQGLDLLEQDALGGSGSRGYGRVRFEGIALSVPGGQVSSIDNLFRGKPFSPTRPDPDLRGAVAKAAEALKQPA